MNIDRMGVDFTANHAGACLSCLPVGSSLLASIDPMATWSVSEHRLHEILCALAGKEIPYPWDESKRKGCGIDGVSAEGMPLDEFQKWYTQTNWKEVDGWQELT